MKHLTTKVAKTKEEGRFGKMRQMLTNSLTKRSPSHMPTNFEEAKSMCKARKRKERQESIGSISQERKVIRSSSEERTNCSTQDSERDIRRVVSHEDFQKAQPNDEHKESITTNSPCKSSLADILDYEDSEHERRRHQERFALPLLPRGRRIKRGRKFSKKCFSKKCTNNNELTVITSYETEYDEISHSKQSTAGDISESSNLSMLLQQTNSSDPVPSVSIIPEPADDTDVLPMGLVANEQLLLSPRNSIIAQHRIFLDPNIQKTKNSLTKETKNPLDKRLKQLTKQISTLKKKLKGHDEEFQRTYGYKPSQADMMNNKTMRNCIIEMNKLKGDYKQLKGEGSSTSDRAHQDSFKVQTLQETIKEIEQNLRGKRIAGGRVENIEEMTDEQIIEEKVAVQQSLLYLESLHGRPTSKDDRDLLRPLYDRYRVVKRLMSKVSMSASAISELATILEDEALDIVTSPPQTSEAESEQLALSGSSESETESSLSEGLHTLTLDELIKHQRETNDEKKQLRHTLKKFENEFQLKTGRKLQKDDKAFMANVYVSYKQVKAKSRLLDALVTKHLPA